MVSPGFASSTEEGGDVKRKDAASMTLVGASASLMVVASDVTSTAATRAHEARAATA
jgi:hypothetical protein